MSEVVHKARINPGLNTITVPQLTPLHIGLDPLLDLCLWYVTNDALTGNARHEVLVAMTGEPLPYPRGDYVGTAVLGPIVLHAWCRYVGREKESTDA